MSKKEEFLEAFTSKIKLDPEELHKNKLYAPFVKALNDEPELKKLFREAVEEAGSAEPDPAAGMAQLFG